MEKIIILIIIFVAVFILIKKVCKTFQNGGCDCSGGCAFKDKCSTSDKKD